MGVSCFSRNAFWKSFLSWQLKTLEYVVQRSGGITRTANIQGVTWQALENLMLITTDSPIRLAYLTSQNVEPDDVQRSIPSQTFFMSLWFFFVVSCSRQNTILLQVITAPNFEFISERAINVVVPVISSFLQGQNFLPTSKIINNFFNILYDLFASLQYPWAIRADFSTFLCISI